MFIAHSWKRIINSKLISINHRFFRDILANNRKNSFSSDIGNYASFELPVSFNNFQDSSFVFRATPTLAAEPHHALKTFRQTFRLLSAGVLGEKF